MKTRIHLRSLIIAVATVALMLAPVSYAAETDQPKAPRVPWEHLALTHDLHGKMSDAELAKTIMKLGREGWELVSVTNFTENGTTTKTTYYFKRRL
jgi:hypothetical protein